MRATSRSLPANARPRSAFRRIGLRLAVLGLCAAALASETAAQVVSHQVALASSADGALGRAFVTLDADTGRLSVTGTFDGWDGDPVALELSGPEGEQELELSLAATGEASGAFSATGVLGPEWVRHLLGGERWLRLRSRASALQPLSGVLVFLPQRTRLDRYLFALGVVLTVCGVRFVLRGLRGSRGAHALLSAG